VDVALVVIRLVLAAVFAVAAVGKLTDRAGTREAVARFGVPTGLVGTVSAGLPVVELAIAAGLVVVATAAWAAVAAGALLLVFCVAIVRLMVRGEAPDCHCFGSVGSAPVGRGTLVRNLLLVGLAGFVAVAGWTDGGESVGQLAVGLGAVAIVLGAVIVLQGAFSWQLFAQNGRMLERLTDLEAAVGQSVDRGDRPALAVGDRAPQFALSDLDGRMVTLAELLSPRRGLVLVFTDPGCGHCAALLPALGRARSKDQPPVVVISRGSLDENRTNAEEHGISPLLVQDDFEIAQAYGSYGIPAAFVIDAAGRIASERAAGADAVAELLDGGSAPRLPLLHVSRAAAGIGREVNGR
jgi:methylamine dehydrogenase accessory protein MauD